MAKAGRREDFGRFAETVVASTPTGWLDPQSTRIDIARLEQRLFPCDGDHVPWRKPSPALAIDDFVDLLRRRSRPPRLRPEAELSRYGVNCPYVTARTYVFMAVAHAESRNLYAGKQMRDAKAALKSLAKVERDLERLDSEIDEKNYYLRPVKEMLGSVFERSARQVEEIRENIRDLPDTRGQPDIWKLTFVFILGHCWYLLTGREPSPAPGQAGFLRFVEIAYETADPDREETWEAQIKTALALVARRPPNDRWNRADFA